MSEANLKMIHELLNEEKWTRATINSYTINNFKELDSLIMKTVNEDTQVDIKHICDEHLGHTKNSIIALYISGIIALKRQFMDDTHIIHLINIFMDNHKWKIVEFLCKRILEFGENKVALRTLSECYSNENEEDKMYDIWERLIRIDYEETDIVKLLAEKKEKEGNKEGAIDFYKKAIHRFLNKKLFAHVKEIWGKLIEYCPEELDFFSHVEKKAATIINGERASQLLEELYGKYKENKDWDNAIEILKRILTYDPKISSARKEIVECFRKKYGYHSQLEEYIKISNLSQSWRNVHEAISDFEKHISFDSGNFVFHRSWGIGRISSIKDDVIVIDFVKKRNHSMSLKMAVSALISLGKDHIWVLKCVWKREKLHDKIKKDVPWALKTIIRSFDNCSNMKQVKEELVPHILTAGEWSTWSNEARRVLKTDPSFGNLPDKIDSFMVREKPISYEEKAFNQFKAAKTFIAKYKTLEDFLEHSDPESEYFNEMFHYFVNYLKAYNSVNETVVGSFFLVKKITRRFPFLNPGFQFDFKELFEQIDDLPQVFKDLEDPDLKRDFLEAVIQNTEDWPNHFIQVFPTYPSKYIIDELEEAGKAAEIQDILNSIVDGYRENREAFIWIAKSISESSWGLKYNLRYEKILIGMVHLLDITFRDINNKRDVSFNRRINKQIQTYLFKDERLGTYFNNADEESISRIYNLIKDIKDLDPSIRIELKHRIVEKYPEFRFLGEEEKETISRSGLLVTGASYEQKQKTLQHILDVEVPLNSKEIGAAIAMGDLRENAEYKAAKEKQDQLNNTAAKLKEDLEKARIFDKEQLDTSKISFGTKVSLKNNESGKAEEYCIFGPWESDPSRSIISYLSPFGAELLNHQKGENLEFVINDRTYNYTILDIDKADIL